MNYQKGLFRVTIIFCIVSIVTTLAWNTNKVVSIYEYYQKRTVSYNESHSLMVRLLNNDISPELISKNSTSYRRVKLKNKVFQKSLQEAKNFEISNVLLDEYSRDSCFTTGYISIRQLIACDVIDTLNDNIIETIAGKYADSKVDNSFPWFSMLWYIFLIPSISGMGVWVVYFIGKYIVDGFRNSNSK